MMEFTTAEKTIIEALKTHSRTFSDLVNVTGLSRSTTTDSIKKLRDKDIVCIDTDWNDVGLTILGYHLHGVPIEEKS